MTQRSKDCTQQAKLKGKSERKKSQIRFVTRGTRRKMVARQKRQMCVRQMAEGSVREYERVRLRDIGRAEELVRYRWQEKVQHCINRYYSDLCLVRLYWEESARTVCSTYIYRYTHLKCCIEV